LATEMGARFGTWNVRNLCGAGSVKTIFSLENVKAKYKYGVAHTKFHDNPPTGSDLITGHMTQEA